ncbi:MAG: MFS transporter [Alphaproteobacteria bacterium]
MILTFVFAAYFTQAVAESPVAGTALWGQAIAVSGLVIAVLSPVLGAIADQGGRRKPALFMCSLSCVGAMTLLWFVRPNPADALLAVALVAIGNVAFEFGIVFYNAMLPELAKPERLGRWSGWAWGLGYAGGLACLVIALVVFVRAKPVPFGLDPSAAEHVRIVAPLVAAWFAVFALPLFIVTPDTPSRGLGLGAVGAGLKQLARTLRDLKRHANVARYLIAHMIYTDGLNTLFAFGGIYAAGTFGMDITEVMMFGIALNVTAGLGAFAFGWVDDWIGPKRTISIALAMLALTGAALLVVESKTAFWALGLVLGAFFGPAQAGSRSFMARLAPPEMRTEMFGLFSLSGKATAFAGPALLAWIATATDSQRLGMATVVVFLAGGLALLLSVREPARAA